MTAQRLIEGVEGSEPTTNREDSEGFDWAELERLMGEDELEPIEYQRLAFALGRILRWVILGNAAGRSAGNSGRSKDRRHVIADRVLALAWTINPEIFDGRPSLRTLAKRYGVHMSVASRTARRATADFGLQNREQIEMRKRTKQELSPEEIRRN
ncbi:MAG: hypothetical protein J0M24_10705 [Verrucomicrobia bacterium]|nr:hypothetical protein [Verrucomicrobiota bacterium]